MVGRFAAASARLWQGTEADEFSALKGQGQMEVVVPEHPAMVVGEPPTPAGAPACDTKAIQGQLMVTGD